LKHRDDGPPGREGDENEQKNLPPKETHRATLIMSRASEARQPPQSAGGEWYAESLFALATDRRSCGCDIAGAAIKGASCYQGG
jgi:hypothetical protein